MLYGEVLFQSVTSMPLSRSYHTIPCTQVPTVEILSPKSDNDGVDVCALPDAATDHRGLPSEGGGSPTTRGSQSLSPALTSHSSRNSLKFWPFFSLLVLLFTFSESCRIAGRQHRQTSHTRAESKS